MFPLLKISLLVCLASGGALGTSSKEYTGTCEIEGLGNFNLVQGNAANLMVQWSATAQGTQGMSLASIGKQFASQMAASPPSAVGAALISWLEAAYETSRAICNVVDRNFCLKDDQNLIITQGGPCKQCPAGQTFVNDTTFCKTNPTAVYCKQGLFPPCARAFILACQPVTTTTPATTTTQQTTTTTTAPPVTTTTTTLGPLTSAAFPSG